MCMTYLCVYNVVSLLLGVEGTKVPRTIAGALCHAIPNCYDACDVNWMSCLRTFLDIITAKLVQFR